MILMQLQLQMEIVIVNSLFNGGSMKSPLRVLIIEDNPYDAQLMERALSCDGYNPVTDTVCDKESLIDRVTSQKWDIILSDYSMPGFSGLEALKISREYGGDIPFIIVSGTVGEETAVHAMKSGANDFVMKGNLSRLAPAVRREINDAGDRLKMKQAELELQKSSEKMKKALEGFLQTMVRVIESKDPYTAGHQQRVAALADAIAHKNGLSDEQIEGIHFAAIIHDIGKISIPSDILTRPGKVNEYEFALIKNHTVVGHHILNEIDFPWPIAEIVYQHHERVGGSGYPQGLKGQEILIEARVLAVADVVESISSHRPYRPALGIEAALEEITNFRGKNYDVDVVDACVSLFRENGFRL